MFTIRRTPGIESLSAATLLAERSDLTRGRITLRWSQASASFHLFSGSTRPVGLPGFIDREEAQEWLDERHPGLKIS